MHTDEFEISLHRELKVCGGTIQRIKKSLLLLEQKHGKTTEDFIKELESGTLVPDSDTQDDYAAWQDTYDSLKRWQALERQYQQQLGIMKI
ncbi:MAG TPA: hypothetical protein VK654_13395 [Nitrospirota bacterium]|nr:hypothetical protein [Nitrospirota bacterium]